MKKKVFVTFWVFLVGLALVISPVLGARYSGKAQNASVPSSAWVEEVFIDYTHAGPGPHPSEESDRYQLTQGGIRWFSDSDVEYQIAGTEAVSGGNAAVAVAVATWDGFVTTRGFSRNDSTTQTNPCTDNPSTVQWTAVDGPGGVLAMASVCRNVATKEIAGFVVTMDKDESWATDGSSTKFDVENTASHEFGHVAGLGHVNAPRDGCLSMYRFADVGEIQKRTLGLGDKLGMDALYSTGDTAAGPGCGL